MHIGIDCRLGGVRGAGIGRYIAQLVTQCCQNTDHTWTLICSDTQQFTELTQRCSKKTLPNCILSSARHYSLAEQLILPFTLYAAGLDLLHTPHFNVPLLYRKKSIVTIHDLLWHDQRGITLTTLPKSTYWIKYVFYRLIVANSVRTAAAVIVPSREVKKRVLKSFPSIAKKIHVIYEGAGEQLRKFALKSPPSKEKSSTQKEINLLMVGSLYPHKNIAVVLDLLQADPAYTLTLVTARTAFFERTQAEISQRNLTKRVSIHHAVTDAALAQLYADSDVFVFPSLSEGFGLPGLEAMQLGVPVVAARTQIFTEIYADGAAYFDPQSHTDLAKAIYKVTTNRKRFIELGKIRAQFFSWRRMAAQTQALYDAV